MRVGFVDNERARPLVTIREDDPLWQGQTNIAPIEEGSIVRAFIPADANPDHVQKGLEALKVRAASIVVHRLPKSEVITRETTKTDSRQIRDVIRGLYTDPDLTSLVEETLAEVGL
jgi:hypothetical protein